MDRRLPEDSESKMRDLLDREFGVGRGVVDPALVVTERRV